MEGSIDDCRPSREIVMFAPLTLATDDDGFSFLMTEVILPELCCCCCGCGEESVDVDSSTVVVVVVNVVSPFFEKKEDM